ncbi:hypothetical protein CYMTET_19329 [Cymbomonas tetramitiformis]|uniref:Uncharacterized protein n=1 Tax=Cymbomonas tetramitiformis TaxID=36881 RepID=A0AAE0G6B6_9CHLO|nr:hypothetical protein CYMTET_19329 [Cymbomonas tetramitiformis]
MLAYKFKYEVGSHHVIRGSGDRDIDIDTRLLLRRTRDDRDRESRTPRLLNHSIERFQCLQYLGFERYTEANCHALKRFCYICGAEG